MFRTESIFESLLHVSSLDTFVVIYQTHQGMPNLQGKRQKMSKMLLYYQAELMEHNQRDLCVVNLSLSWSVATSSGSHLGSTEHISVTYSFKGWLPALVP